MLNFLDQASSFFGARPYPEYYALVTAALTSRGKRLNFYFIFVNTCSVGDKCLHQ